MLKALPSMKRCNCWQILEIIQRRWYTKLYAPRGSVYIVRLLTPSSVFSHISVAVVRKNWRDGIQQLQEATDTLPSSSRTQAVGDFQDLARRRHDTLHDSEQKRHCEVSEVVQRNWDNC